MIKENKVWAANTTEGVPLSIHPKMANRHGLIAGATGTGKTVTLKVLAESFSDIGVPVFLADVKGDLAGTMTAGTDTEDMQKRIERFGLSDTFAYKGYPVTLWDIYGQKGIPLRTTISEIGPLLLSRVLRLNDLQTDILTIVFKIADDNNLLLVDTKDLKAMLHYVEENSEELAPMYGKIRGTSIGAITRAVVGLELDGGDQFFGETALNIGDWLTTTYDGKGAINILDSESLINNGRLYATFLLWLMSELFERLPEVGDPDKPKMVFFFDEAHLLFDDASKELLDKIEQVVKLIRSKGVGIYFCTQNPRDIPEGVLSQLGNKIQHALRAYTPADQKRVKAAAESFRANPEFDTVEAISNLGIGEAIVSFLQDDGIPAIAQRAFILPPQSRMGPISDEERNQAVKSSLLYSKYAVVHDPDSAYEFFLRMGAEEAEAAKAAQEEKLREAEEERLRREEEKEAALRAREEEREEARKAREAEREAQRLAREEERRRRAEEAKLQKEYERQLRKEQQEKEREAKKKKKAVKSVGSSVVGTVGREVGKQVGGTFGSFGKKLGGNLGASLGRGILDTLFKG